MILTGNLVYDDENTSCVLTRLAVLSCTDRLRLSARRGGWGVRRNIFLSFLCNDSEVAPVSSVQFLDARV